MRISRALPEYPDLEGLLDYISREVKRLLNVDAALVVLHDEVKQELYFQGAAYDDKATEQRAKRIRYPVDRTVAGEVIKTILNLAGVKDCWTRSYGSTSTLASMSMAVFDALRNTYKILIQEDWAG